MTTEEMNTYDSIVKDYTDTLDKTRTVLACVGENTKPFARLKDSEQTIIEKLNFLREIKESWELDTWNP